MIVGIDVDGVLVDLETYQLQKGKIYFKRKYNKDAIHPDEYDIESIFECTHEQREKFWTKYIWEYCLKTDITKGASDTVNKIRELGHEVYIITGRAHTTEKGITGFVFRWMLKHWLKKHKLKYDKIFFVSEKDSAHEKNKLCLEEGVDIMIDDKPENLLGIKDKIKVVCFPAVWNKDIAELDEYRIEKFEDLLTIIE